MTSRQYFNSLNIIWLGLIAGQVVFAGLVYYIVGADNTSVHETAMRTTFVYVVPAFLIGGIFTGNRLFRSSTSKAAESGELGQKLIEYRSATITRFALFEVPSLFAIVICFLTSDLLFLFYTGLSLVLFFYNRPTPEKTSDDLNLDPTERVKINNPEYILF